MININKENKALINDIVFESINEIKELSKTCCVPNKSKTLQSLNNNFKDLSSSLENSIRLDDIQKKIEEMRKIIGSLMITCCSGDREIRYHKLFKNLNNVFNKMYEMNN